MYPVKQPCTPEAFKKMLADYPKKELNAFTPLILSEAKWVLNIAYNMLKNAAAAEDARNESLVKWVRQLAISQDYQQVNHAYLHTIIKHTVFDLLKKQKLEITQYEPVIHDKIPSMEEELDKYSINLDQLNVGLDDLPEPCKSMLLMKLKTKMTQKTILEKLEVQHTVTSVTGIFRNCRERLREIIFVKFKINRNG